MITVNQENRNLYSSWWKRHRNFADYFCCSHKFSAKLLLNMFKINICQPQTYSKTGIIIWVRCMFSHQSAEVQFVMFYWLHKARVGGRSYSSTTDNYWIFTQTKVSSIYRHKPLCRSLDLDETSSVIYNFLLFSREDSYEILASVCLEEENFEGLKRCYIQNYPLVFCCVMIELLIFYMCEILEWRNVKFL